MRPALGLVALLLLVAGCVDCRDNWYLPGDLRCRGVDASPESSPSPSPSPTKAASAASRPAPGGAAMAGGGSAGGGASGGGPSGGGASGGPSGSGGAVTPSGPFVGSPPPSSPTTAGTLPDIPLELDDWVVTAVRGTSNPDVYQVEGRRVSQADGCVLTVMDVTWQGPSRGNVIYLSTPCSGQGAPFLQPLPARFRPALAQAIAEFGAQGQPADVAERIARILATLKGLA